MQVSNFKVDFSQPIKILDEGKISLGGLYEHQMFDTESEGITNLEYERNTASSYVEFQTKWKKFDFTLGTRAENYDISGTTRLTDENGILQEGELTPFNKFKLFPNASVQYSFMNQLYLAFNYNKKINESSSFFGGLQYSNYNTGSIINSSNNYNETNFQPFQKINQDFNE